MASRLGEAGQNHAPMLLASMPAEDGAVSGIRDGGDDAGAAEPLAQAHAIGGNSPFLSEPKGTVAAKPASAPKSLRSGNQLTIARPATKLSTIFVRL
jgi:hypothetical protein